MSEGIILVMKFEYLFQDDCDSDMRSDISTNEPRRHKLKGSTELKKSPSNVTTTTLVATTRLPRVQHWETHEKHNTKNWEFPRQKLTLQTILGQGNFGQVSARAFKKKIDTSFANESKRNHELFKHERCTPR